jgi:L-ascorbate metabolism protein UlaG (beta-lactamase superfamily)
MAGLEEKARKLAYLSELVGQSATAPLAGFSHEPTLVNAGELGVTFIGHSSFLIQIGGQTVLVDPVFAKWLVVLRRLRRPGVHVDDLPPIDAVLLSHAHMDHLNRPSLRRIVRGTRKLTGKAPVAIVPWGVEDLIQDLGFARIISLEWWQSTMLGSVDITLTPQSIGARGFSTTLIADSAAMSSAARAILSITRETRHFFQGFAEIGRRLAPEVALLPIGAYSPDNFRSVHTSPEDALRGFLDLRARFMVPMHFGTFRLSAEPVDEPLPRLLAAARKAGVEHYVCALSEGQTRIFPAPETSAEASSPQLAAVN